MQDRTAFTLIELLVVIAIIALLMAILMPALRREEAQAIRPVYAALILLVIWLVHWLTWPVCKTIRWISGLVRRLRAWKLDRTVIKEAWDVHEQYLQLFVDWVWRASSEEECRRWIELAAALKEYRYALIECDFDQVDIHRSELEGILATIRYHHINVPALR